MAIIQVIKWDAPPSVYAFKYPNSQLTTKSQLVVSESQEAYLLKEGRFCGSFGPGRHVLNTKNYPFLTPLLTTMLSGGESPFTAEVWFIQKAINVNIKWGTVDPVLLVDPKYKIMVPVRSFGQYGIRIDNPKKFLAKLVGRVPAFTEKTLTTYFQGVISARVKDSLATYVVNDNISVLEISTHLNEIAEHLKADFAKDLTDYGISIALFVVSSISIDNNDPGVVRLREALARKTEMDILGYNYQQERSFDTMQMAASNTSEGASVMNMGMGLGMGVGMGQHMGVAAGQMAQNVAIGTSSNTVPCPKCSQSVDANARFCPHCGSSFAPQAKANCPSCHAEVKADAKFCPSCGSKIARECKECNSPLSPGAGFCPNCGADNR